MTRGKLIVLAIAGVLAGFTLTTLAQKPPPPGQPAPAPAIVEDLTRGAVGGTGDRQVVLSEAQVNQQLTQHLQENPGVLPFREPQVRLRRDGRLDVRGFTQVGGRETEVQAVVKVRAQQGKLDLEIENAQAGNVPIPAIVAQEIAERAALAAGLSGLKGNALPEGIESVSIEEGRLVITRR